MGVSKIVKNIKNKKSKNEILKNQWFEGIKYLLLDNKINYKNFCLLKMMFFNKKYIKNRVKFLKY